MPLLDPLRTLLPDDIKLPVLLGGLGLGVLVLWGLVAFDDDYATPTAWPRGQIVCGVITRAGPELPLYRPASPGSRRVASLLYENEGGEEGIGLVESWARGFVLEVRGAPPALPALRRVVVEGYADGFDVLTGGGYDPLEQVDAGERYEVHVDVGDTVCLKREDSHPFGHPSRAPGESIVITDLAQIYHATPGDLPAMTRDTGSMIGALLRRLGVPLGVLAALLMIGIRLGASLGRFGLQEVSARRESATFALPLEVAIARLRHLGLFEALSSASQRRVQLASRLAVALGFDAAAFALGALLLWPALDLLFTGTLDAAPGLGWTWFVWGVLVASSAVAVTIDTLQRGAGQEARRQGDHQAAAQLLAELLTALSPALPAGAEPPLWSFEPRPTPRSDVTLMEGGGSCLSVELPLERDRALTLSLQHLTRGYAQLILDSRRPGSARFSWAGLIHFEPGSQGEFSGVALTFRFAQARRDDPAIERIVAAALQALRAGAVVSASAAALGPSGGAVVMRQSFDAPQQAPERSGELRVAVRRKGDPVTPRVAASAFRLEALATRLTPLVAGASMLVGLVGLMVAPRGLDLLDLEGLSQPSTGALAQLGLVVAALFAFGVGVGLLLRYVSWPAPPLVAEQAEAALVLGAEDRTLRLSEVTIHLDRPFTLNLTRSGAPGERGLLGVEVLQQGEVGGAPVRLRLSAALQIDEVAARLPELDSRADAIDARALAEQVWPALRAAAAAHGEPPRWTLHVGG